MLADVSPAPRDEVPICCVAIFPTQGINQTASYSLQEQWYMCCKSATAKKGDAPWIILQSTNVTDGKQVKYALCIHTGIITVELYRHDN